MRRIFPATAQRRIARKKLLLSSRRAVAPLREIIFFFSDPIRGRFPPPRRSDAAQDFFFLSAAPSRPKGFTLVELVVVIVIVGILSALGGLIITNHMEGYEDMRQRAELVDSAESALRRMQRDIRAALPNSIRTWSNGQYEGITFLHTAGGGRYRTRCPSGPGPCNSTDVLNFENEDSEFSMLGHILQNSTGQIPANIQKGLLVVYNTGQSPADAYSSSPNNTTPIVYANASGSFGNDATSFGIEPKEFPYSSPYARFQIVDEQVRYVWDKHRKTLKRYQQHATHLTDPKTDVPSLWGEGALVNLHVSHTDFTYEPGTSSRSGLMTLELTLSDEGETVSLLHQVHVLNFP
jgi:MSHA biogenesis protein MshO